MSWPPLLTLAGEHVRLEPLELRHHDDLVEAVCDGELWRLWYTNVPAPEEMYDEIVRRRALADEGSMVPFAVIDRATDEAVGMTTYMRIDAVNRRLEIGSTWYRERVQRTALNTECKLLLLLHAFETLGVIAVEFRTSAANLKSRRAIERLGAKLDGILRSESYHKNGTLRDTHVYSIVAAEWPAVKDALVMRVGATAP